MYLIVPKTTNKIHINEVLCVYLELQISCIKCIYVYS